MRHGVPGRAPGPGPLPLPLRFAVRTENRQPEQLTYPVVFQDSAGEALARAGCVPPQTAG
ncbi:hypothetical protein [Micromonospora craniellae]|uniref:Uncharacterized protein n=1 Tax=Micromonospora craniellae TaxID=2294034 RepID=A0A372FTG9_9ACTN|nr:hypothetical protein [Micromonospora craniellae]QOC91266.1 hypothetical protein ID554_25120 [Micromonospora craniellae]RFS43820.1 hypothetical protein D0Q02_25790 [Micromonospora craniellae]